MHFPCVFQEVCDSVCEGLCCCKLWTSHFHIVFPTVAIMCLGAYVVVNSGIVSFTKGLRLCVGRLMMLQVMGLSASQYVSEGLRFCG